MITPTPEDVAEIAYEADRRWRYIQGEYSAPGWHEAKPEVRAQWAALVKFVAEQRPSACYVAHDFECIVANATLAHVIINELIPF